jgi:N6-L-threonylcarbamoyladenine synthase
MYVLGIETSCDETAAAVVEDGRDIRSNTIASSLEFHKKYGGIIPEIASRMHLDTINFVVDGALLQAKVKLNEIKLIAVTEGPGLPGSLLVGISFAKSLGVGLDIPLVGINHLEAHLYSAFLNQGKSLSFPTLGLVASGGHTSLFYLKGFDRIELLGSTLDDACGEAFDKVAKILGLGYPGGPLIERLAKKGKKRIRFSCSNTNRPLDFSFSGIKTAVLYYVRQLSSRPVPQLNIRQKENIAASFQETVINTLIEKSLLACRIKKVNRLVIGGGVALNNRLRQRFYEEAGYCNIELHFPEKRLCMDNAAMVAGLGYQLFRRGHKTNLDLTPNLYQ